MEKQFEELRKRFGTHCAAAEALGVTRRTYLNYRTKGKIPASMRKLIERTLDESQGELSMDTVNQATNG